MPEFQRARVLGAIGEIASQRGYDRTSVAAVVDRARVSRKTFYKLFDDREECFLAMFEDARQQVTRVFVPPYEGDGLWPTRLRDALVAALHFLEQERDMGVSALSYLRGASPLQPGPRERALHALREVVLDGRRYATHRHRPSPITAEATVAGVLAVIHTRLQHRDMRLTTLVNPLMSTIVVPYLGPAAAAAELRRKSPRPAMRNPQALRDPLAELGLRVTYRTAKTLATIAQAPGSSNVELAAEVGISDQGQISKLLSRLARIGLIENTGLGQAAGAANAWRLTAAGAEANAAINRVAPAEI